MTDTETEYDTNSTHQCQRYIRIWNKPGRNRTIRRLMVGWDHFKLSFEYTDAPKTFSDGGYIMKCVNDPSHELRSMVGLFIVDAIPASILADKLQEEQPELEWAAEFLREWERAQ